MAQPTQSIPRVRMLVLVSRTVKLVAWISSLGYVRASASSARKATAEDGRRSALSAKARTKNWRRASATLGTC
jgi:hypothetical protein